MPVAVQTFEQLALEDPDRQWELHQGRLQEKPGMGFAHNRQMARLGYQLMHQLDWSEFDVRVNAGHLRHSDETYYIPDVIVIPAELTTLMEKRPEMLEVYDAPLPLVVEVWSPSTGTYDVDAKLPEYRRRGDAEIWQLHPFERTLGVWRRQADGTYQETEQRGGTIRPVALPEVVIDLDARID